MLVRLSKDGTFHNTPDTVGADDQISRFLAAVCEEDSRSLARQIDIDDPPIFDLVLADNLEETIAQDVSRAGDRAFAIKTLLTGWDGGESVAASGLERV